MKFSTGLLLPAFISAASAILDANVYIFQGQDFPSSSTPPTLTPTEARLVFAQRLGVSEYHEVGDAGEAALPFISQFTGHRETLFNGASRAKAAELILIVEGISSKSAEPLLTAWSAINPAFTILDPPSSSSNLVLARDLQAQIGASTTCSLKDAVNPFEKKCWNGKSKVMHIDLSEEATTIDDFMSAEKQFLQFAKREEMNVLVVLMPEACRTAKSFRKPYGSYAMPSQSHLGRRQQSEEPMTEGAEASPSPISQWKQVHASNSTKDPKPLLPVPAACYVTEDACNNGTNSCSGHGKCAQKWAKEGDRPPCFACFCAPTEEEFKAGDRKTKAYRITYWGGAACQKKDVSGPFWLFAGFTVIMIGLISWAIGMLFSIGEEKLPGVIGAGVSSKGR